MHRARVVLVIPNSRWFGGRPWLMIPHAALLLTAMLRRELDFGILDANAADLSEDDVRAALADLQPAVVLVSGLMVHAHRHYHRVLELAKEACPETRTVLGGPYPTVLEETALSDPNVDFAFLGRAEGRINAFLRLLVNGEAAAARRFPGVGFRTAAGLTRFSPPPAPGDPGAGLVNPDYSLLDVEAYLAWNARGPGGGRRCAPIVTSYGCPRACLFCATHVVSGGAAVFRSPESVLAEIDFLVARHGVEELLFLDDCLLDDHPRVTRILEGLLERGHRLSWRSSNAAAWRCTPELLELMRRTGCRQLTVAVESGSPRVLREIIGKPLRLEAVRRLVPACRALGIGLGANFVVGFPGESLAEIRETVRFAEECDFDAVSFHIATPLPKTGLYDLARERGLLPRDFSFTDPRYSDYHRAFLPAAEYTPEELTALRASAWERVNFATPEKAARAARFLGLTAEELDAHRCEVRRGAV